jgi:predicted nucleic acid-binding Zn ribbon protein
MHVFRNGPMSDAKVTFAWRTTVGPALERVTSVKLEDHVLMVDTDSAQWSKEITRSSGVILGRLQGFLGKDVITRIVVRSPRV